MFKIPSPAEISGLVDAMDVETIVAKLEEVETAGNLIADQIKSLDDQSDELDRDKIKLDKEKKDLDARTLDVKIARRQLRSMEKEHRSAFRRLDEAKFAAYRRIKAMPR